MERTEADRDERDARLLYAVNGPDGARPEISAERLRALLPDIDEHDVYLCGPPGLPSTRTRRCTSGGPGPPYPS